jgi:hypothetical protein
VRWISCVHGDNDEWRAGLGRPDYKALLHATVGVVHFYVGFNGRPRLKPICNIFMLSSNIFPLACLENLKALVEGIPPEVVKY